MEPRLQRIKELIIEKERVDAELEALLGGAKESEPRSSEVCGQPGHSSRTCPTKEPANAT